MEENLLGQLPRGPSFETLVCDGLLRMRSSQAARNQTLMVRSA